MAKTEKTKAELYREERKARLAKAAKKRSKKKMSGGAKAVIAVFVAVVIVLGVCSYSFVSLGISRQMDKIYSIEDVADISLAEYTYYYNQTFSYYFNNAAQYEQYYASYYGEGAGAMFMGGYEYTKSPETQAFPETHADYEALKEMGYEEPTWADYFDYVTRFQIAQMKVLNQMADKAGFKLDKEGENEIDETYGHMKEAAGKSMISVNKYLSIYYGKGVTKSLVKKAIREQIIAQHYQEVLKDEYRNALTAEEIEDGYKADKDSYDVAGIAYYTVSAEKVTTKDEEGKETENVTSKTMKVAKEKANELAKANDYADLSAKVKALKGELQLMEGVTKSTIAQYLGEEVSDWLYSSKTKVGDIKVVEQSGSGYLVACAYALPERDDTKMVSIRQIELTIPEEEEIEKPADDATEEKIKEYEDKVAAQKEALEKAEKERAEADKSVAALDTFKDAPVFNVIEKKTSDKNTYLDAEIILRKYLAGDRTEDSFKALADEQAGADTSSEDYEDSSLVENIYPNSNTVDSEVEAWALDKSRKTGDVGVVECAGEGYYVLYFKETLDESNWEMQVKDSLAYDKIDSDIKSHETKVLDEEKLQSVIDATMVLAKKQIAAAAESATASY